MQLFFAVLPFLTYYGTVLFFEYLWNPDIRFGSIKNTVSSHKAFWKVFGVLSSQNIANCALVHFNIIPDGPIRWWYICKRGINNY